MTLLYPKPTKRPPAAKRRPRKQSERPRAQLIAHADKLCSALVKRLARNKCEARGWLEHECGGGLDWAHGIGRRALNVRYSHANSMALCRVAHRWFGWNPLKFEAFRVWLIGGARLDHEAERARMMGRVDVAGVIVGLRASIFLQGER